MKVYKLELNTMTRIRDEKKYSILSLIMDKNGKEHAKAIRLCFYEQSPYFLPGIEQNGLLKIIYMLLNAPPAVDMVLCPMKKVVASCKKAMYNIRFSPLKLLQRFKMYPIDGFTEEKSKDSRVIGKPTSGLKRLTLKSSPLYEWEISSASLGFLCGETVPKPLLSFGTPIDYCRPSVKQVMELCSKVKALRCIFDLIKESDLEPHVHSEIASHILSGWNDGCIPKVKDTPNHFLDVFIQSLSAYVDACIKVTQQSSDSIPTEEDTPVDKQKAQVPAMTKTGLKKHMASLRQMWCQEYSAGLAEDLLREDRQRALRRFGKEQGLKQHEIDNILNRSSASLQEKAYRLMEDWQHGRGGSIVRRGKQLEEEQFIETIEALKRDRNPREDKDT
ncbi:uncharacterized protein LOC144867524 [Branchiostoma floridae x Branchiostoma japonicum]